MQTDNVVENVAEEQFKAEGALRVDLITWKSRSFLVKSIF